MPRPRPENPLTSEARRCIGRTTNGSSYSPHGREDVRMSWLRNAVPLSVALGAVLAHPPAAWPLPNPGPLRFIGSTPADGGMVTTGTVGVAVDASCTFD